MHCMQMQKVSKVQQIYSPVDPDNAPSSLQQKFTTTQVVYIHLNISSKTQVAFPIASKYFVHLWSDVQSLYTIMETSTKL